MSLTLKELNNKVSTNKEKKVEIEGGLSINQKVYYINDITHDDLFIEIKFHEERIPLDIKKKIGRMVFDFITKEKMMS